MTSSMLTGEQRWASARRGGLKNLGKIVVPKPINLPSQKLENHGLNPNVEIVPKGTNSWGSRPSSSPSNAWGSATLSPTTDGGGGSPSHLSGRPSSGGSGTRPSSASSDRSHEPTSNVWGPNSRPSSASGALQTNLKSLTSLRPRSAETRPSSSQLSRFAEPSENPVTWGASGTAERLGVRPPKNDGFSLSSGDFPTLGTEKDDATKNIESQEHDIHSRPGSSSSGLPQARERSGASSTGDASPNSNVNSGNVNTWRRDNTPYDGFHPNVEQWQGEPQPYQNANMPPQPFGPWHGNPPPGVVWYRGPPSGPPYGPPLPPGGFPMDYPYYHGQIPVNGPNSMPMPSPGAGPRGPHPQTGDMYRPHIPDPYIRPGMPVRPGFFPGHIAYESYYAPPMGHYNPNERDIPFRGMAPGPSAYNRYTGQAATDSNKSQAGPGGYGPTGKTLVSEKMDSGHSQDPRGQYKVILKHHNGWDGKEEVHKWENAAPSNAPYIEKGDQPRPKSRENSWRPEYKKNDYTDTRRDEDYSRVASVPSKGKVEEEHVVKESYIDVSASPGILATPKDTTLIQKIEGLNAKVRASDVKDVTYASGREEQKSSVHAIKPKVIIHPTNEVKGLDTAAINETSLPRKAIHGAQDRVDNRGKGRFNKQADGWQKPIAAVTPSAISALNSETINAHLQDRHVSEDVTEKSGSYLEEKDDVVSGTSMSDPSDILAQRAKMREIAKQRAKELQKEEEERTRDQKAKALAKLEELNRRTQAVELTQKLDNPSHDESTITTTSTVKTPTSVLVSNTNIAAQKSEMCSFRVGEFDFMSTIEAPKNSCQVSIVTQNQALPLQQGVDNAVFTELAPQHHDSSVPKQKRTSYKQKLKIEAEKSSIEKKSTVNANEAPKTDNEVANNVDASAEVVNVKISESSSSIKLNSIPEPTVNQKRKNNRNNKSKHKQEETTSTLVATPSHEPKDVNIAKVAINTVENSKENLSEWDLPMPVEPVTRSKDENLFLEHQISGQSEESHGRVNNQWKSHNPRRLPRNQQVHRAVDKFHGGGDAVVWAPVRSQNKVEVNNEDVPLTTKSDNPVQNNLKNKRAEMERYVPKPVSKELNQQGSVQGALFSSGNQVSSDETVERVEAGKIESSTGPKIGDFKQNKQTKAAHGSWKQRGSSESTRVQDGSTLSSKPNNNIQQPVEDTHFKKHDVHSVNVQAKLSDECNNPDNSDSAAPIPSIVVKDQSLQARAKRQPYKGNRNTGNYSNYEIDHKNTSMANKDKVYSQSSALETNERPISQWQPKSQAYSHDQKGSRPIIQTGYNEAARLVKDSVPKSRVHLSSENEIGDVTNPSHIDHSIPKTTREAPKLGNQNTRRGEKKVPVVEYAPNEDMVPQNEQQRFSSGYRRNGNQNNRFGTGHESRREWSSSGDGQDNKQERQPVIRDRQRHNSEYEQKSNNFEGPGDGPSRFRDRGPTQSRRGRGGFYGRQSDNVGVDAAYD